MPFNRSLQDMGRPTAAGQNMVNAALPDYQQVVGRILPGTVDAFGLTPSINNEIITDCSITKLIAGNLTVLGTITGSGGFQTGVSPDPRIVISATEIAGYSDATTRQFYILATDGKGYFGAGNSVLDAVGMTMNQPTYLETIGIWFKHNSLAMGQLQYSGTLLADWVHLFAHARGTTDGPVEIDIRAHKTTDTTKRARLYLYDECETGNTSSQFVLEGVPDTGRIVQIRGDTGLGGTDNAELWVRVGNWLMVGDDSASVHTLKFFNSTSVSPILQGYSDYASALTWSIDSADGDITSVGNIDLTGDGTVRAFKNTAYAAASYGYFAGYRALGTLAAPTPISAGGIGLVDLRGYGYVAGTTNNFAGPRAGVRLISAEAWTDSAQGASVAILATPIGSTTMAEYARFAATGLYLGGAGNATQALHVAGNMRLTGALYDVNNSVGTSGQVLSTTGSGVDWVTVAGAGGIIGGGTANYLPKWTAADTLGDSVLYESSSKIGLGTLTPNAKLEIGPGSWDTGWPFTAAIDTPTHLKIASGTDAAAEASTNPIVSIITHRTGDLVGSDADVMIYCERTGVEAAAVSISTHPNAAGTHAVGLASHVLATAGTAVAHDSAFAAWFSGQIWDDYDHLSVVEINPINSSGTTPPNQGEYAGGAFMSNGVAIVAAGLNQSTSALYIGTQDTTNAQIQRGIDFQQASIVDYAIVLPNVAPIVARNAANSAKVSLLSLNASNNLELLGGALTINGSTNAITVSSTIDGVDVATHTHTGAGTNGAQLAGSTALSDYSASGGVSKVLATDGSGNLLISKAGESSIRMINTSLTNNPEFRMGRIALGGDGDPGFRWLYKDDVIAERLVFLFDSKGIVASNKPAAGSHFEGFLQGASAPLFRLNSSPAMQLEMGPGGSTVTDVALVRHEAATMTVRVGGTGGGWGTGSVEAARFTSTNFTVPGTITTAGDILDVEDGTQAVIGAENYADSLTPTLRLRRARGSLASPTQITAGALIGQWVNAGWQSGGAFSAAIASIRCAAAEALTSTNQGTYWDFLVTPIASTTLAAAMRLTSVGLYLGGGATPTAVLDINSDILRLRTAKTPASAAAAGNAGDWCWDSDFFYICIATNSWHRVAHAAW